MSKTTPTNREDRCGTTSLAFNTPWRRERTRRQKPSTRCRCVRISVQNRSRRPESKNLVKKTVPQYQKRDPPYRKGQWHRQRGMIRLVRSECQQLPPQRAHSKTTGRNKSLQRSQEPKSTCQAEQEGRRSNKASRHRQKTSHPYKGRKNLAGPKSKETPRVRDLTTPSLT